MTVGEQSEFTALCIALGLTEDEQERLEEFIDDVSDAAFDRGVGDAWTINRS